MKTWDKPELAAININETAGGLLPVGVEWCWVANDGSFCEHKEPEKEKEVTPPTDPKREIEKFS